MQGVLLKSVMVAVPVVAIFTLAMAGQTSRMGGSGWCEGWVGERTCSSSSYSVNRRNKEDRLPVPVRGIPEKEELLPAPPVVRDRRTVPV